MARSLTAAELEAMLSRKPVPVPFPAEWQHLFPAAPKPDAIELTKSILEALPIGTPVSPALEGVVAALDLVKGASNRGANSRFEKLLMYSSDLVDIASLLSHVVPGLDCLDTPLRVLGIALKCGDRVYVFSLTPEPQARAAGGA